MLCIIVDFYYIFSRNTSKKHCVSKAQPASTVATTTVAKNCDVVEVSQQRTPPTSAWEEAPSCLRSFLATFGNTSKFRDAKRKTKIRRSSRNYERRDYRIYGRVCCRRPRIQRSQAKGRPAADDFFDYRYVRAIERCLALP